MVETERLNHARGVLEGLTLQELAGYDGVVAVGGDGLFQETINGLLAIRWASDWRAGGHCSWVCPGMHMPLQGA